MNLINKTSQIILIRYALGYNQSQMASVIGVSKETVQAWERETGVLEKRVGLAYRYVTLTIPESEQIELLLRNIDSDRYVLFLRSLNERGSLPRTSVYQCRCEEPNLTYSHKKLQSYSLLVAYCTHCNRKQSLKHMGSYRRFRLMHGTLDLYDKHSYDFESWRANNGKL